MKEPTPISAGEVTRRGRGRRGKGKRDRRLYLQVQRPEENSIQVSSGGKKRHEQSGRFRVNMSLYWVAREKQREHVESEASRECIRGPATQKMGNTAM